jgi:hypothetical protein
MPGSVPGIHEFLLFWLQKRWMAGAKPGHDAVVKIGNRR